MAVHAVAKQLQARRTDLVPVCIVAARSRGRVGDRQVVLRREQPELDDILLAHLDGANEHVRRGLILSVWAQPNRLDPLDGAAQETAVESAPSRADNPAVQRSRIITRSSAQKSGYHLRKKRTAN